MTLQVININLLLLKCVFKKKTGENHLLTGGMIPKFHPHADSIIKTPVSNGTTSSLGEGGNQSLLLGSTQGQGLFWFFQWYFF